MFLSLINFYKFITGNKKNECCTITTILKEKIILELILVNHRHRWQNPIFTQKSFNVQG